MTKTELIQKLYENNPQLQLKDVDACTRIILDAISEYLARGDRIEVRGFGSFSLNYRPPRKSRNPKSGASVMVPAKHVPHFKAGIELRERVDVFAKKIK